jgi:hypothetical protein
LSIYWPKTKSYVEKWRNFPINKFSQIIGHLKFKKKKSATACSWFIFVFHPSEKVCHSNRKHDDGTGLVKMQEDPRPSTCCCTAKYFLLGS